MYKNKPTPETDAAHEGRAERYLGGTVDYIVAAKLEYEKNEAEEAIELTQRELNEEVRKRQNMEKQLDAMREAIKEAQTELAYAVGSNTASVMKNNISAALAKLQPFLNQ